MSMHRRGSPLKIFGVTDKHLPHAVFIRSLGVLPPPPPYIIAATEFVQVSEIDGLDYSETDGPSAPSLDWRIIASGLSPAAGDITVTPSANIEIYNPDTASWTDSPFTVAYTDGGVSTAVAYTVRLKANLPVAEYNSESVVLSGGDAPDYTIAVTGERAYHPQAQDYFDRLVEQPATDYKSLVNELAIGLDGIGALGELDRMGLLTTGPVQANANIDFISSTGVLTPVNSPGWTENLGYQGDGLTSYINTNYTRNSNAVHYTQNQGSLGFWSLTNKDANMIELGVNPGGALTSTGSFLNVRRNTNQMNFNVTSGTASALQAGTTDSTGLFEAARTASNLQTLYRNGVSLGTNARTSTAGTNDPFYLLARNDINTGARAFSDRRVALWFIGSGDWDKSDFYDVLQTFITGVLAL